MGYTGLDKIIADIEALADLVPSAAPLIAQEIKSEIGRTIAAGTDPYGKPWAPTQDGTQPLQHAAKAVTVTAVPLEITISGPEALHHLGRARGRVTRTVIPVNTIPTAMAERITKALEQLFKAATS